MGQYARWGARPRRHVMIFVARHLLVNRDNHGSTLLCEINCNNGCDRRAGRAMIYQVRRANSSGSRRRIRWLLSTVTRSAPRWSFNYFLFWQLFYRVVFPPLAIVGVGNMSNLLSWDPRCALALIVCFASLPNFASHPNVAAAELPSLFSTLEVVPSLAVPFDFHKTELTVGRAYLPADSSNLWYYTVPLAVIHISDPSSVLGYGGLSTLNAF